MQLLLRLHAESIDLPAGALVELISTDPVSVVDLPAWCHLTGHAHLGSHQVDGTYVHAIRLSGRPALTRADAPWGT
ncbi:MAG: sulfurtransferase TusA family protein [Actinomycetota bacterium]|nr:sulfurtransferase TusA family protein [Actinomycetota bacterium]